MFKTKKISLPKQPVPRDRLIVIVLLFLHFQPGWAGMTIEIRLCHPSFDRGDSRILNPYPPITIIYAFRFPAAAVAAMTKRHLEDLHTSPPLLRLFWRNIAFSGGAYRRDANERELTPQSTFRRSSILSVSFL